jgi:hypothetical protein
MAALLTSFVPSVMKCQQQVAEQLRRCFEVPRTSTELRSARHCETKSRRMPKKKCGTGASTLRNHGLWSAASFCCVDLLHRSQKIMNFIEVSLKLTKSKVQ